MNPDIPDFLRETATALGAIPGVEAVAWCGSVAMGVADAHSDYDFYVYTNAPVPVEKRRAVISEC
jgi:predicted nucleotidyltransferase